MAEPKTVEEYIAGSPEKIQPRLTQLRTIILSVVPKETEEKISYSMPLFSYLGPLVYFGVQKNYIGLYIPPPIIDDHKKDLAGYITTKSAIHFPNDQRLPTALIKKLVKARIKHNEGI